MTTYRKSMLFFYWVLLVFFTFPLWMSALEQPFGERGMWVGMAFWLGHGVLYLVAFRCPDCGLSPFMSERGLLAWATPWPRKTCGNCGRDHRAPPAS